MKYSLHISPKMWDEFKQAMLENQQGHEEVIGFFFCDRYLITRNHIRYIPKIWIVPSPDCYEYQAEDGLVLKQAFHLYLLQTYLIEQNYHIVHIHTHLGEEMPYFSSIDDQFESEYAKFLTGYCSAQPRFISGVFNQSLERGKFRIWSRKGDETNPLVCYHQWLAVNDSLEKQLEPSDSNLQFARQQIFGQGFKQQLEQLTVSLIGCGGIGAIFAELLGRLGVKKWVLIDRDRLEITNLNRMPSATLKMANQQWDKVDYVKGLIKKIHPYSSHVKSFSHSLQNVVNLPEIRQTNLIVVATDNHYSRQLAQEIAIAYHLPFISLGTHIELKKDNQPKMYARITIPPLGGNWCLMCANVINLQQSALENAGTPLQHLATENGYLPNIPDPSVFWLNSLCASTAVGIIQGIMTGMMDIKDGLDWICQFPHAQWLKTDPKYLNNPDCYFCGNTVGAQRKPAPVGCIGSPPFLKP